MPPELERIRRIANEADCLFTRPQVEAALDRMADEITDTLQGRNPLVICVMNGGIVTGGCLLTRLDFPLQLDYLQAGRYGNGTAGGVLAWRVEPQQSLRGRDVLVVDDILDEGHTLLAILSYCREQGAAHVYSAVLVDKVHDRKCAPGFRADFTGLEAPDRYLFGYGLDYHGYLRNAPGLFALSAGVDEATGEPA